MPGVFIYSIVVLVSLLLPALAFTSDEGYPKFRRISDASLDGYAVRQMQADLKAGPCVVLLDKHRQRAQISQARLTKILGRNGKIVAASESNNPSINCHSFACLRAGIMLPRNAWLDADRSYFALLKEYFVDTGLRYDRSNVADFGYDHSVRDGDLVLMTWDHIIYHSGIVIEKDGYNWVLSKLDEDMTVKTPLENLWEPYGIDAVKVFRRK